MMPTPLHADQTLEPTPDALRRTMSTFATGVTVVTGYDADEPVGFTCQSFASVSLDPPLVLFCADHRSTTWPRIRSAGRFGVNVLREDQLDVCTRFGSRNGLRFDGLSWTMSRFGTPSLPGALSRVHCAIEDVHRAGDHDIVVGRVLGLDLLDEGGPLVFFRGRFDLAEPVSPPDVFGWGL